VVDRLFREATFCRGTISCDYVIAGRRARVEFAGGAMYDRLAGAFAHLLATPSGEADLHVCIWDAASTGVPDPPMPGVEVEDAGGAPIQFFEDGDVRAIVRWDTLSVYDRAERRAWFWAPDPELMVSWDWASPLRQILHWWLGDIGLVQVHGGAVGLDDGGVLVVGRGGSGKSTTTLTCLGSKLHYAGDDFVGVQVDPEPFVHSLYSSGKLEPVHLERFPELAPWVANDVRGPEDKAVVYAHRQPDSTATTGFPLRAILVPMITGRVDTACRATSPAHALGALAPSTIFQLHPPHPDALRLMGELARSVPCFSLELGTDLKQIPGTIDALLRSL
jgi:hypothetical protein